MEADLIWGANETIAAGSAALALISLVLNWLVVQRQTALQFETLRAEIDKDIIAWAHEAIDLVSQGVALARERGVVIMGLEFQKMASDLQHRLSAIADRESSGGEGFSQRASEI